MLLSGMRKTPCVAALFGLLALAPGSLTQTPSESGAYKLRIATRLATADVLVRDSRSKLPVNGLQKANFRVFDNDREQPITQFDVVSNDTRPLALVLLLDLWWGYAHQVSEVLPAAVRQVMAQLRPGDKVAIVTWQILHRDCVPVVEVAQDFTADGTSLTNKLEELLQIHDRHLSSPDRCDSTTSTDFKSRTDQAYNKGQSDGVRLAADRLLQLDGYRREIVDFDHDYADGPKDETAAQARSLSRADIGFNLIRDPVFILDVLRPLSYSQSIAKQTQDRVLNYYVEQTGGTALSPAAKNYGRALEQILTGVRASYSLGWRVPEADGAIHTVRIELVDGPAAILTTRKSYVAPGATEP